MNQKLKVVALHHANLVQFFINAATQVAQNVSERSINDVLMEAVNSRKFPEKLTNISSKDNELYYNIIDTFENMNIGFLNSETTGKNFIQYVKRLIDLDPQWRTLSEQGFKVPGLINNIYQTQTGRAFGDLHTTTICLKRSLNQEWKPTVYWN